MASILSHIIEIALMAFLLSNVVSVVFRTHRSNVIRVSEVEQFQDTVESASKVEDGIKKVGNEKSQPTEAGPTKDSATSAFFSIFDKQPSVQKVQNALEGGIVPPHVSAGDVTAMETDVAIAQMDVNTLHKRVVDEHRIEREGAKSVNDQERVQHTFVKLMTDHIQQVRDAVTVKDAETEQRIQDVYKKLKALEDQTLSNNEFKVLTDSIQLEIEELKSLASGHDKAFQQVLNQSLSSDDIGQHESIRSFRKLYATKEAQVDLEQRLNDVSKSAEQVRNNDKLLTQRISQSGEIANFLDKFEKLYLTKSNGEVIDTGFVKSLEKLEVDTYQRLTDMNKRVDAMSTCKLQEGLQSRVDALETMMESAYRKCDDATAKCNDSLGQDSLVLKSGGFINLGNSGKVLMFRDNDLKICNSTDKPDGVLTDCRGVIIDAERDDQKTYLIQTK